VSRLSRYIFLETLRPSLLGLMFYTFVLVMNQLFVIVRQAFERGAGFSIVIQLLVLALPKLLVLTIPMSLLLGVLVGLGRLSADSEVVALRAAGVSYWRMARPVVFLGFLGFPGGRIRLSRRRSLDEPPGLVRPHEHAAHDRSEPRDPRRPVLRRDPGHARLRRGGRPGRSGVAAAPHHRGHEPRRRRDRDGRGSHPGRADAAETADQDVAPPPDRTVVIGERGRIELAPDAGRVTFIIEKGEIHIENPKDPEGYQRIRQRQFTTSLTLGGSDSSPKGASSRPPTSRRSSSSRRCRP
jgi:hypothetical protein